jgi:hypothetical protein
MKAIAAVALLVLLQESGCDQKPAPAVVPPTKLHHPTHRFEDVSPTGSLGVALDTVTGQWCRTWDWAYKSDSQSGGLDTLPTCKSLFDSTPADDDFFAQFGGKKE